MIKLLWIVLTLAWACAEERMRFQYRLARAEVWLMSHVLAALVAAFLAGFSLGVIIGGIAWGY